jgi:carbamoyl-phosphate synthase large subunit
MNILLTSAGRRGYMVDYFKQALKGDGLIHAANSYMSPALVHADRFTITPLIYDAQYIDYLLDYSIRNNIKAIIPLFDIDLPILAKAKEKMRDQGVEVIVSDYKVTQICNDKWMTYGFLKQNDICAPQTYISLNDAINAVTAQSIRFPLIVKPRWGMGSIGILTAENRAELEPAYYKVQNQVNTTYLRYESEGDIDHSVIIQEKLCGYEYGLDVINDLSCCYMATLVKKKIAMRHGETDSAVTERNEKICTLGAKLSSSLKHVANLDVDCFLVDDVPYILELNCRFGGGYPFSHLAGANIPLAIIKWLKGQVPDKELFEIEYGVEGAKDINPIVLRKAGMPALRQ